jgi:hypothetical protein
MISFRMIALMVMIVSVSACWPRGTEEVEVPVEVVEDQVTDAVTEGVGGFDVLEIEITEEIQ